MADATRRDDLPTLERLERRRWQLWLVTGVLLAATSAAVVALVLGPGELGLPAPVIAAAVLGVTGVFLLYTLSQERTFRRVTRTLFEQLERETELVARLNDLKTLVRTSRSLNTTLSPDELYGVVLDGAMGITGAGRGALYLRHGDRLVVSASSGAGAPEIGHQVGVGEGDIGALALDGDVVLTGDGPTGVCAPIVIRGTRVGVLSVERLAGDEAVTDRDITMVRLFAEQAATAVANATSYEQERARVEALVDAAEQRSDFVARMIHDLRAPLSAISGYGQLVRDRAARMAPDQLDQAIGGVLEQSDRMSRMIGEVLAASAVEAGAEVRREPVDLAALLDEVAKVGIAVAESRGDRREISVRGSADAGVVHADPEALRAVFTNLVDNAIKYSPAGSEIRVQAERADDGVDVHVIDRGQGIPEDELASVFERFRQSDRRRTGVGLGLYIVRTLVRAHGGQVSVRSKIGTGTAFTVHLPRHPVS